MSKVRVAIIGTVGKSIRIESDATIGAQIGTDLRGPDGEVLTVAQLAELIGLTAIEETAVAAAASGVTDHTLLTSIGTNSHAAIDTHIADSSIHLPLGLYEGMSTSSLVSSDFTEGLTFAEGVFVAAGGAGATLFGPSGLAINHPGVWGLRTGTTAAGRVFVISRPGSYHVGGGGVTRVGTWFRTPSVLSTVLQRYTLRNGLFSINLPNVINFGIGFEYDDSQNGGRWQAITDAAAETSVDTGVTVAVDTWYKMEFEVDAAGTSVEFFIDDVSVGTIAVAANIPAGTGFNLFYNAHIMKLIGTTSVDAYIDAYYVYQALVR